MKKIYKIILFIIILIFLTTFNPLELNLVSKKNDELFRIKNIEIGLNRIGIKTKSTKDSLTIFGNPNIQIKRLLKISPKEDHRIGMAFFCLSQLLKGKVKINNFQTVNTSFPKFFPYGIISGLFWICSSYYISPFGDSIFSF